ncbi:MAG: hypothetical protein K1X94_07275 [Sandaracinaceae bacterium]|nr:hypothetical protein [Sandaracinaceae bacterium]
MRVLLATLALVLVTSCDHEEDDDALDEPPIVVSTPPPPESPITPRGVPREVPEFCLQLWGGLDERDGIVNTRGGEPRYEPMTLAAARGLLETRRVWVGAVAPGWVTDEGRAYHRLRESPDALTHFEHLYRVGPERVAALYAACGLAELDRDRYAEVLAALRANRTQVETLMGDFGRRRSLSDIVDDGAFRRLYASPGGFLGAYRDDTSWGQVRVVQSLDPFVPGPSVAASERAITDRRVRRAIESEPRLMELIPERRIFDRTWWANAEVRGDALDVQLVLASRERFAMRFTVDAETGEARDLREMQW